MQIPVSVEKKQLGSPHSLMSVESLVLVFVCVVTARVHNKERKSVEHYYIVCVYMRKVTCLGIHT